MAKDQKLALNPAKLSGVCGRLMCCLIYEHESYARTKACGSCAAKQGAPPPAPPDAGEAEDLSFRFGDDEDGAS
jgi:hypothetical protein